MHDISQPIALVLGATGGIGGAVARRLSERGWHIRALTRDLTRVRGSYEWIKGDAMNRADVLAAAQGAALIVHAVNPPGYRNWGQLVLPMLDNTIAAAGLVGARIVLPGTVYNFGPDTFPTLTEDSPQRPLTKKGAIRVEMERRLEEASRRGVGVIVVRAGDYFGPGAANNWFAQLVRPGHPVRAVTYPGRAGLGHQWAYLPDVAETMVRLVEKAGELPAFAVYHMQGVWDRDGRRIIGAIERAAGRPLKIRAFAWWLLPLASPFVTVLRELKEMRYLWEQPLRMKNDRLLAVLGSEPSTPLDEAVRATLAAMDCLPQAGGAAAALRPS